MKKILLAVVAVCLTTIMFGQAKKPTIMVVPSDNWCIQNNYTQVFDNQGTEKILPD